MAQGELKALLDIDKGCPLSFGAVAVDWLRHSVAFACPSMWAQLQDCLPLAVPSDWDSPHGPPGGVWAKLSVFPRGRGRPRGKVYSPQVLDEFTQILSQPFERATLKLHYLNESGVPALQGGRSVDVIVDVDNSTEPEWMQLSIIANSDVPEADVANAGNSMRWAAMLQKFANAWNPAYGQIYTDKISVGWTGLDTALRRSGRIGSLRERREYLRGYSWVTIVPQELGERIEGFPYFDASGNLNEVKKLSNGGFWVQATPEYSSFGQRELETVFAALKPILPPGAPKKDPFAQAEGRVPRLVWQDAAE